MSEKKDIKTILEKLTQLEKKIDRILSTVEDIERHAA